GRARDPVAPWPVRGLGNADTHAAHDHWSDHCRTQFDASGTERPGVVAFVDRQRLGQAAWSCRQRRYFARAAALDHPLYPPFRLESTDKHRGSAAADDVEAPVDAVGTIDVGMGRRSEHRRIARGRSREAVRCGIVGLIGLRLDDDAADAADQQRGTQQIGSNLHGGAVAEPDQIRMVHRAIARRDRMASATRAGEWNIGCLRRFLGIWNSWGSPMASQVAEANTESMIVKQRGIQRPGALRAAGVGRPLPKIVPEMGPADPAAAAGRANLSYVSDAEPGIRRQGGPRRFRYVANGGEVVRDAETLARIRMLAIPPAWTHVWICASPDGHIQATG